MASKPKAAAEVAVIRDRAELRRQIETRLKDTQPETDPAFAMAGGISPEHTAQFRKFYPASPVPAAVLVPIVDRADGPTILLTQRSAQLKNHAGQISFPGGRIESSDAGPKDAALRETEEEIGLTREHVQIAGYLDPHIVLTGFFITPVVGFIRPGFTLKLDSREVETTFEVPLAHLLDEANHQSRERVIGDVPVLVYDIPFGNFQIWGATAGILMNLYRLLVQPVVGE